MIKKFLQFAALALLLAVPLGGGAQNSTLTICNGTANHEYVPFYGYYADESQHNQLIYPADSLTAISTGDAIMQMVFYIDPSAENGSYTDASRLGTWTVSLGETTATTLNGLDNTTALTEVYEGYFDCSAGTLTLVFDEAYVYHGGNLLVDLQHSAASYNHWFFLGVSATGASYCYGSQRNFLPKVTFTIGDAPSCVKPTGVTLNAATVSSLTFGWHPGGSETSWEVMVGDSLIGVVSDTIITVNGLNASSRYNVSVRSVCGAEDSSTWTSPVLMATSCAAIANLPWNYGFEGENSNEVPFCWTRTVPFAYENYNGDTLYTPYSYINGPYSNYSHTGTTSLYFYIYTDYNVISDQAIIASPYIAHNPADLHVTFWAYRYTMNEGDTLQAGIMTDPNVASTFIPLTTITSDNMVYDYVQYEFYTGSLADSFSDGDSACIAFRSIMNEDHYSMSLYIDDIEVDAMGNCLAPSLNSGNIDSISYEGVQLSWECSDEPEDGYVVRLFNTQNQTYSYYDSPEDSLLIESGLDPNTTYQAWVATVCGDDTTSYTAIGTFTTHYRCYAVVNPTVAALTANAAALTWDFTGIGIEPTNVEVVLMDLSDSSTTTLNVTDDNCIFSGLTEGRIYEATFVTTCGDDDTSWSVSVSFMPHAAPCAEFEGESTSQYVPFYSLYNNGFSEMLYSGTEFAGFDSVNGISFQVAGTLNRDNIVDIWMSYVPDSITGLTADTYIPVDSMIHVVSNYSFSTATADWTDVIPFDTLFPTQATGNVVIAVYNHTGSWSSGLSWATHTSTVGNSVYGYTDNSIDITSPFTSISSYSQSTTPMAANIQVYGNCIGGDCVAPGARVASVDTHSVTLTWLPGGSESSWNVLYRVSGTTNWTNFGAAATVPLTITGLNAGTDYQFRVGSDCGDTIAYGTAVTGTTLCGPVHAPFSITPNGENNCWTYNGYGSYSSYSNYYYIYDGGSIMTPVIADSINTLQLRLNVSGAGYYVGVCDASGQNITWVDTVPAESPAHDHKTYLHHYNGNGTNIIIKAMSGYNYTYINQITVEPLDDCMPVENLAVDSVTTTDAWLSWVSEGNNFLVKYMDEADTTYTWQTATSTINSIHLTGMNSNARYQVKVFNVCGANSQSDSVTVRLIMGCTPYTTPYREQFGQQELPVCWNNVTAGSTYTTFSSAAEYGYDYVYSYGPYSGTQVDWLMTPEIQVPTDAENYRFLYQVGGGAYPYTGYTGSYGAYDLYISTTGSGDTSLYTTLLLSDTLNSRTSSTTYVSPASVSLTPYAGQTVSFAFRARTAVYGAVYIADVEARFAGEPLYYLSGNGTAFVGENNAYVANYLEGALDSMTYTWTSTMATAGHATMSDANTDTMHIVYNAPGTDTLMFVASNQFGSDTNFGVVYVYQCDVVTTYPWVEDFEEAGALACWRQQGDAEWTVGSGDGNTYSSISAHSGTGNAVITHTDRGAVTKLITPVFNLAGTPNATLTFWHIQRVWGGDQDELHVYYRNSLTAEWTLLTSYTNDIQAWTLDTITLPNTSATYQIAFEMHDDYGYGVAIDSVVVMGVSANCSDPVIVSTDAEETSITFNWTGEASNYEVAIAEVWNADSLSAVSVTDSSYTFSGLTAATEYTVGVRAVCGATMSSDWVTVTVVTDEHPCFTPSDLTVTDVTLTSATLGWTLGEAETQWALHVTGTNYDSVINVTTNPYTLTGLASATDYSFTVTALCSETQQSDASEAQTFTTLTCQPVSSVTVSNITTNSAQVSWTASAGVASFELEYGASGFASGTGTRIETSTNSASLTGLTAGMAYDVYVRSSCGNGAYSAWSNATPFETEDEQQGIEDVNSADIALFPNPATTTVTLTGIDGQATVTIVDMNGRVNGEWKAESGELTIDLAGYAQGAYFVRITGEQVNAIRKLIVK